MVLLGFSGGAVEPRIAQSLDIAGIGILISSVKTGGPAEQAGLIKGDIILEVNNKEFATALAALHYIAASKPSSEIELTVIRHNKVIQIKVKVGGTVKIISECYFGDLLIKLYSG